MMSNLNNPMISVLMSVHNGENYLRAAIKSILNQTFRDFEFIVVNDGSTDRTGEILEAFRAKDERLRVLQATNHQLTLSLNRGLSHCRGKYIARMDADDISLPDRLAEQYTYLEANPDCVLLGAEVLMIDAQGWPIASRGHALRHDDIEWRLLAGDGGALTHPVIMMRMDSVRRIGGYHEQFTTCQDVDLFLRLAEVGRVANLPSVLLKWRQHAKSDNHTRYDTWGVMKEMALTDAAARRGITLNVERLVVHDRARPKKIDFHLEYANRARLRHSHTALKHLVLSTIKTGLRREHFQCAAGKIKQSRHRVNRIIRSWLFRIARSGPQGEAGIFD